MLYVSKTKVHSRQEKKISRVELQLRLERCRKSLCFCILAVCFGDSCIRKNQLLDCGFIDNHLINSCFDENSVLKRFIDERVVGFEGNSVLAPVWDLVNHSSFAQPFRVTPYGVETPPLDPTPD